MTLIFDAKRAAIRLRDAARHLLGRIRYDFRSSGEVFAVSSLRRAVIYRADGKIGDAICFLPFSGN